MKRAVQVLRPAALVLAGIFSLPASAWAQGTRDSLADVRRYGARGDGRTDDTRAILSANDTSRRIHLPLYFPAGRYPFNGDNLPWAAAPTVDRAAIVANRLSEDIVPSDDDGLVIGLQQNPLETEFPSRQASRVLTSGDLLRPPLARAPEGRRVVDVVAHWYNDFGLEYTRLGGGGITWYTWQWNHHGNPGGYDPSRHPLLGWYRGDDPIVVDWICHWLVEYGVAGVTLNPSAGLRTATWQRLGDRFHWIHEYLTNAPNCSRLPYVLWGSTGGAPESLEDEWVEMIDSVYAHFGRPYTLEVDGGLYPAVFLFDGEQLRKSLDGPRGASRTHAFLRRMAARLQRLGYAGIGVLARFPTSERLLDRLALRRDGVLYFAGDYSGRLTHTHGDTYSELVRNFDPRRDWNEVLAVPTSTYSKPPHPSRWPQKGTTPQLFGEWLRHARDFIHAQDMPNLILVYNVSEWAEGGPGLVPNMQDRFAYLRQVLETTHPSASIPGSRPARRER